MFDIDTSPATSRVECALGLAALDRIQRDRAALAARESQILVAMLGAERREQAVTLPESEGESARTVVLADADVDLVAASLHRSPVTMQRQVARARLLHRALPATFAALQAGRITEGHADVITRTAHDLPGHLLPRFEREVLAKAEALTVGEVGTLARRVRARLDRDGEEARRAAARRHEDVRVWVEGDGLACLQARLPIADAARVHAALDERARAADLPCDATLGQRRARGLVDAVCGGGSGSDQTPAGPSRGVEVLVTVDLATLVGLGDAAAMVALGCGAPEPITAPALRELLGDPTVPVTLRRLVTDPATGIALDRGRTAYRVTDALREFLVARDLTCRFPGCAQPAWRCDIDHARPWGEGGTTDVANLGPLCRRHHLLKTHAGWRIEGTEPDGRTVWTGPGGRSFVFHPFPAADPPDRPGIDPPGIDPPGTDPPGEPFPF